LPVLYIMQHRVALAESPPRWILAAEPHTKTLAPKTRERERFRCRPIQWLFAHGHFLPCLQDLFYLWMRMKIFRQPGLRLKPTRQVLARYSRLDLLVRGFGAAFIFRPYTAKLFGRGGGFRGL